MSKGDGIYFKIVVRKNGRYIQQKRWSVEDFKRTLLFPINIAYTRNFNAIKFVFSSKYRNKVLYNLEVSIYKKIVNAINSNIDNAVEEYSKPVKGSKR